MAIAKRPLATPAPHPSPPPRGREGAELAKQTFEYAPAPESIDHVKIESRYGLFIGGKMVAAHSKKHFPTINPATEQ